MRVYPFKNTPRRWHRDDPVALDLKTLEGMTFPAIIGMTDRKRGVDCDRYLEWNSNGEALTKIKEKAVPVSDMEKLKALLGLLSWYQYYTKIFVEPQEQV